MSDKTDYEMDLDYINKNIFRHHTLGIDGDGKVYAMPVQDYTGRKMTPAVVRHATANSLIRTRQTFTRLDSVSESEGALGVIARDREGNPYHVQYFEPIEHIQVFLTWDVSAYEDRFSATQDPIANFLYDLLLLEHVFKILGKPKSFTIYLAHFESDLSDGETVTIQNVIGSVPLPDYMTVKILPPVENLTLAYLKALYTNDIEIPHGKPNNVFIGGDIAGLKITYWSLDTHDDNLPREYYYFLLSEGVGADGLSWEDDLGDEPSLMFIHEPPYRWLADLAYNLSHISFKSPFDHWWWYD